MNHVDKRQGFTLIELMLAMGFVSALLIAVAMTVIQIAGIYNRGIMLKDINQVGRTMASELQRSVTASTTFDVGSRFIKQSQGGNEVGGRLCLGQYSYVWNYGKVITPGDTSSNPNVYSNPDSNVQIRFVKVLDQDMSYCTFINKKIVRTDAVEMLDVGEHDLALHSFNITTTKDDLITPGVNENTAGDTRTGQQLYSIEFFLGTNDQSALTGDLTTTACRPPNDPLSDPSYCSVNQFNIVARTGKKVE